MKCSWSHVTKSKGFLFQSEDLTHRLVPFLSNVSLTPYPFPLLVMSNSLGLWHKLYTRELPGNHGAPPPILHASQTPSAGVARSWTVVFRNPFQKFESCERLLNKKTLTLALEELVFLGAQYFLKLCQLCGGICQALNGALKPDTDGVTHGGAYLFYTF